MTSSFGSEPILVVNASGAPIVLPERRYEVQVTGKVAKFQKSLREREFDFRFTTRSVCRVRRQPALIAQSIALAPEPGVKLTKIQANTTQNHSSASWGLSSVLMLSPWWGRVMVAICCLLVLVATPTNEWTPIKDGERLLLQVCISAHLWLLTSRDYDLTWDLICKDNSWK